MVIVYNLDRFENIQTAEETQAEKPDTSKRIRPFRKVDGVRGRGRRLGRKWNGEILEACSERDYGHP